MILTILKHRAPKPRPHRPRRLRLRPHPLGRGRLFHRGDTRARPPPHLHQHTLHHTDPKNTHYCPVTNMVNPVLEKLRFWAGLEWIIWRVTDMRHRQDTSVRGQGPGPAWLTEYRPVSKINRPAGTTPATTPSTSKPVAKAKCCGNCAQCKHHHSKAVAS